MPAEGRENPLLKKGNSDAFFREKYLTKNRSEKMRCEPAENGCASPDPESGVSGGSYAKRN